MNQAPPQVLHGVIDDDHIQDMRERNKARAEQAIRQLGKRWILYNPRAQDQDDMHAAYSHTEEF